MKRLHRICALRSGASLAALGLAAPILAAAAHAAVVISSKPTQNMSCSAGVCAPTAKDAVLNVGDLQTMLASGNVSVTTTGSGVQAMNIRSSVAFSWSTGSALTLDAYQSLTIDQPVSVQGLAGLSLVTNDGGKNGGLSFGKKGNVTFANLSSSLTIDGTAYTLENTIASLASAIAANPAGAYALANSFDASQGGTYTSVPIPTAFTGTFEGLGNAISNLSINDSNDSEVGLFAELDVSGTVRDVGLLKANIASTVVQDGIVGSLVGYSAGTIVSAFATGSVSGTNVAGGLVGANAGTTAFIILAHATTDVSGVGAGGLAGGNDEATIAQSYATGRVSGSDFAGGLTGSNNKGSIANTYSTGTVLGGSDAYTGGLVGDNDSLSFISNSYSVGKVKGSTRIRKGGFVGFDGDPGDIADGYWDLETSGIKHPYKGAGNRRWDPGITGLTTEQLQSGLPQGFDPSIWGQNPNINNGLPYLLANPPAQ